MKIVKTILNQDVQTFRFMSVAYGSRELTLYIDSHPFSGGWSISNLLSFSNKQVGTLKEHLQLVLSESDLTRIHSYISVI